MVLRKRNRLHGQGDDVGHHAMRVEVALDERPEDAGVALSLLAVAAFRCSFSATSFRPAPFEGARHVRIVLFLCVSWLLTPRCASRVVPPGAPRIRALSPAATLRGGGSLHMCDTRLCPLRGHPRHSNHVGVNKVTSQKNK